MIFLESSYGLANRMRAIASGVGLSTDTIPKQKLNIIWPQNDALNMENCLKQVPNRIASRKR
jgi:hypothetical protein